MNILPEDIFGEISKHLPDGKTAKSWMFVCKKFSKHITLEIINKKYVNHLETLIKKFHKKFDSNVLENKYITWEFIKNNPHLDKRYVSENPNVTWDIVMENPKYPWDWCGLSKNPNITWDIIIKNRRPWVWTYVSMNPNITIDIVLQNPNKPWSWEHLSLNKNITPDIVEHYPELNWDARNLSQNPSIFKDVNFMLYHSLNFSSFVDYENDKKREMKARLIKKEDIENILEMNDFEEMKILSLSPLITWDIVVKNSQKKWYWSYLSKKEWR